MDDSDNLVFISRIFKFVYEAKDRGKFPLRIKVKFVLCFIWKEYRIWNEVFLLFLKRDNIKAL